MINAKDELEAFLRYNRLSWQDVICLDIIQDNGWGEVNRLQLGLNYTSEDLEQFLNEAKQVEYPEYIEFFQKLSGTVWLTNNRWIERVISIYDGSERWELKQMPEIPFS